MCPRVERVCRVCLVRGIKRYRCVCTVVVVVFFFLLFYD